MPAALERTTTASSSAPATTAWCSARIWQCGLDILLVDRRLQYGGALVTEEVTAPGFYHNLHSINHFHISETPWFKDLGLGDRVTYITPRYEFGQPHLDGIALVFGRDLEETLANIARFSKRDAADLPRLEPQGRGDHGAHLPSGALRRAAATGRARGAAVAQRHRPRLSRGDEAPAVRRCAGAVRERARAAAVSVQGLAVRHLAHRHPVQDEPDGLGDPRLRPAKRLPALPGRLVQPGARPDGDLHRGRRALRTAGRARPHRDRGRPRHRHRSHRRPHRARPAVRRQHVERAPDLRGLHRTRAAAGRVPDEARRIRVHQVDALRPASGAARARALPRGEIRSEHQPRAEMEPRRGDHGRAARGASARDGGSRAADRAVRLRRRSACSTRPRRRRASTRPMPGT